MSTGPARYSPPAFTVGVIAAGEGIDLAPTVAALQEQLGPGDEQLIVFEQEAGGRAAARNQVLRRARMEVTVFLQGGWVPVPRWLEAWRGTFGDERIEAAAGALEGLPVDEEVEPGTRPGGRLRWTGHLAANWHSNRPGATALAHGANCAIRTRLARRVGGFDEAFGEQMPGEDTEFFVRLGKWGARVVFVPGARVMRLPQAPRPAPPQEDREDAERWGRLQQRERHSRSMAAIFARHEAWALSILFASHAVEAVLGRASGRLPAGAVGVIMRELIEGVRRGGRPVQGLNNKQEGGGG